ncbi:capping protein inhibiting regulator of actin dynamics-like [Ambystoma mexicanum]|uniref:capping protein inhibiting regulator of actin dynamics-like n=1 Tax=Ambystoma mexicanum TaxID=8296 RepID=UPI0037E89398
MAPFLKLYENINETLHTVYSLNSTMKDQITEIEGVLKRLVLRMDKEADKSHKWQDCLSDLARRDANDKQYLMEAILEDHKWICTNYQRDTRNCPHIEASRVDRGEHEAMKAPNSVLVGKNIMKQDKGGPVRLGRGPNKIKAKQDGKENPANDLPQKAMRKMGKDERDESSYAIFGEVQNETKSRKETTSKGPAKEPQDKLQKKPKNQSIKQKECGSRTFLRNIKIPAREEQNQPAKKPRLEMKICNSSSKNKISKNPDSPETEREEDSGGYLSDSIELIDENNEDEQWQNISKSDSQAIDNQTHQYETEKRTKRDEKRKQPKRRVKKTDDRRHQEPRKRSRSREMKNETEHKRLIFWKSLEERRKRSQSVGPVRPVRIRTLRNMTSQQNNETKETTEGNKRDYGEEKKRYA